MAAILHDTVEDTDTTFDEIESHFGKPVRDIVAEVTDDKTKPKQQRKRLQIEHASGSSCEAKLVKLADKLYNLRDLEEITPEGWSAVTFEFNINDFVTKMSQHFIRLFIKLTRNAAKSISNGLKKWWTICVEPMTI